MTEFAILCISWVCMTPVHISSLFIYLYILPGLFPAILAPGLNWEKMIDLTSKLGEINDIEHNKGSKIYAQIKLF